MNVLKFVEEIEGKYNVNSVVYKNAQLWPYFRIYLSHNKIGSPKTVASKKVVVKALKNMFYGFRNYFKKVDYIIFSNTEQRRLLNNKYYDRFDFLPEEYNKNLFFELTQDSFYKLNQIPTKNIVSKIPLYFLAKILEKFVSLNNIDNANLFTKIIDDNNIELNSDYLLKSYIAQYKVAKLIIKIYKPKALILITSYTNYAYIQAFKDAGINVIEFQHGLINDKHLAYNFKHSVDAKLFPDYVLTFGEYEKEVFNSNNNFINTEKVIPIGHFYLDYLNNNYKSNENFERVIKKYKKSFAITLQANWEDKMIEFIEGVAKEKPEFVFVIIPRHKQKYSFKNENVLIFDELNCYEIVLNCDIHSTIYSSCATEALGLNKPNILLNIDNQSNVNLGFIIDEKLSFLANTTEEFINKSEKIDKINTDKMLSNKFFKANFTTNLKKELNNILSKNNE